MPRRRYSYMAVRDDWLAHGPERATVSAAAADIPGDAAHRWEVMATTTGVSCHECDTFRRAVANITVEGIAGWRCWKCGDSIVCEDCGAEVTTDLACSEPDRHNM